MLRKGDNHWNSGPVPTDEVQLPDESTLQVIAESAIASSMTGGNNKQKTRVLKIANISGKPHPTQIDTTIVDFSVHLNDDNRASTLPISVLMKKTGGASSIEFQAYSTVFKDLQPKNVHSFLQEVHQRGSLYKLIPRPYLIRKPYLFLENIEHVTYGEFKKVQDSWGGRKMGKLNLDFNHCLLAVETLARFHATSYTLRRNFGVKGKGKLEMLQKYPFLNQQSTSQQFSTRMSSQLTPVFSQAFEMAVKVVEQENPSLAFKLQRKVLNPEGIFEKVIKLLEEEKYDNDDFYVVCHGNFIADNLLFSYNKSSNNEEPNSCRITNFNSVFFGPLASDLALFLLTCTTLEFRLEFEEKLLAFYCDAFQDQLVARYGANSPIVEEFEEEIDEFHRKVEKQYKKMMEFAFYNATVLLPVILFTSSADSTDSNNGSTNQKSEDASVSIKDLLEGGKSGKYFPKEGVPHKKESDFEKFAMENPVLRERLVEILKQLAKSRVLL